LRIDDNKLAQSVERVGERGDLYEERLLMFCKSPTATNLWVVSIR